MAKAKKTMSGPELDCYIREDKERRYSTYRKASLFYSIPYYQLVRLAKEANACWKIRKTVLVDLEKIEIYLETFREGSDKENVKTEK